MELQDRKKLLEVANQLDEITYLIANFRDFDMAIMHLPQYAETIRTIANKP